MPGLTSLRHKQRREARLIVGSAAALILVAIGFVAWQMAQTFAHAIDIGQQRAGSLSLVLEEQTRRTVQVIDAALLGIADRLSENPEIPSHDPAFTAKLRDQLAHLPYVRALFVVGKNGFIVQDSDEGTPDVSLADRDYFRIHVGTEFAGLYVGRPLKSRSTQIGSPWFLSMSRRITLPGNRFYGVAVAAVEPRYFSQFYERIELRDDSAVALVHGSGLLIARYPQEEGGTGVSLAETRLFTTELPRTGTGLYVDPGATPDDIARLYSYRTVAPLPLIVQVGLSRATLLADWRKQMLVSVIAAGAFVVILGLGAVLLIRQRARDLAMAEHLQRVDRIEAIGQIASSIAHDFNNILTVIGGNVELARDRLAAGDPVRDRLSTALDGVERGCRMAGHLLTFARQQPVVTQQIEDVCTRLNDIADLLRQAARPCGLRVNIPDETLFCLFDNNEFDRALMNLVVNARDATKGTGLIIVSVQPVSYDRPDLRKWPALARGEYIACTVQDEGEGMPPDVLRRVFEPFFTTKPEGAGTGLGLSQVLRFARASGGDASIDSAVGAGTTVTLMLPRAAKAAEAAPSSAPARERTGSDSQLA